LRAAADRLWRVPSSQVARLSNDTAQLQRALTLGLVGAMRGGTLALGATAALVYTSPALAAIR
jgi:hypothetical protein